MINNMVQPHSLKSMKNIRATLNMKILKNNFTLPTHYSSSVDLEAITLTQFFFFQFKYSFLISQLNRVFKQDPWIRDLLESKYALYMH